MFWASDWLILSDILIGQECYLASISLKPLPRQRKSVTSLKSNKIGVEEKDSEKENTFPTPIIGSKAIQQKYAKNKDSDDEDEDEEAEWQKVEGRDPQTMDGLFA